MVSKVIREEFEALEAKLKLSISALGDLGRIVLLHRDGIHNLRNDFDKLEAWAEAQQIMQNDAEGVSDNETE